MLTNSRLTSSIEMMRKIYNFFGFVFIGSGIIFLLIHRFIVTSSTNEDFARDLFGFPIPHPPVWTSYIPYLGGFLGFIFEFFSIHGLIGIVILGALSLIGGFLISLNSEDNKINLKDKPKNKKEFQNLIKETSNVMLKSQNKEMLRKYGKK